MSYRSDHEEEPVDDVDSPVEGLEEGTLSIKANAQPSNKDVWKRYQRRPIIENATTPSLRFEILFARIMPSEEEQVNCKKYVVYDLCVRQDTDRIDSHPETIERRYTHFLKLYESLRKDYPRELQGIYFPKKVLMGNFSPELISQRSAAFEQFLDQITACSELRDTMHFLHFLQGVELAKACQLLDERRNEMAVPILENCFRLLNKVYMDRSKSVLLLLCRLVAACTASPVPHSAADKWAELALRRYEGVCDADLLVLYVPLLQTCLHLWWQRGKDNKLIEQRLEDMRRQGVNTKTALTLTQAIHAIDPRAETN